MQNFDIIVKIQCDDFYNWWIQENSWHNLIQNCQDCVIYTFGDLNIKKIDVWTVHKLQYNKRRGYNYDIDYENGWDTVYQENH